MKPGANGKLEAFIVCCIRYRDQFGCLYHTGFMYWLVDPQTHYPIEFNTIPDSKVGFGKKFELWHSGQFVDQGTCPDFLPIALPPKAK